MISLDDVYNTDGEKLIGVSTKISIYDIIGIFGVVMLMLAMYLFFRTGTVPTAAATLALASVAGP